MTYTIRQTQVFPLLTHRGWIPSTPWPELEILRWRLLTHLEVEHQSESGLYLKYDQLRMDYQADFTAALHEQDHTPDAEVQLVPSVNELASARMEEAAWMEALVMLGEDVKAAVDLRGDEWQASLGDVDGLAEFARKSAEIEQYIRRMGSRYSNVVSAELVGQVSDLLAQLPAEAQRVHRLATWIGRELVQPLGLGFAFYEDKNAAPEVGADLSEKDLKECGWL